MSEQNFKNKLVAVLNKSIEPGKVMNALAHMCIGLGSVRSEINIKTRILRGIAPIFSWDFSYGLSDAKNLSHYFTRTRYRKY